MEEKKRSENGSAGSEKQKPNIVGTVIVSIIGIACVFLFGPLETMLGCLVWVIIRSSLGKDRPYALWHDLIGVAVGVLVAFGSAILYTLIMSGIGQ